VLEFILGLLAKAFGQAIADIFGDMIKRQDQKNLGRAEGAIETGSVVREVADEQAANNAENRSFDSVLERLRLRRSQGPGGNAKVGS
jgi:hypothetical protein